jgi:hypothetical protein
MMQGDPALTKAVSNLVAANREITGHLEAIHETLVAILQELKRRPQPTM